MPRIRLTTEVRAPRETCFDLSRSIDLHVESMATTREQAVAGRTTGLIELGEEVTWRGRHFGVVHEHVSRITAYDRPSHFRDEMVRGRFKMFRHDHGFEPIAGGTLMIDDVEFESPGWILGRLFNRLVLTEYLTRLLRHRNEAIRKAAEAGSTSHGSVNPAVPPPSRHG